MAQPVVVAQPVVEQQPAIAIAQPVAWEPVAWEPVAWEPVAAVVPIGEAVEWSTRFPASAQFMRSALMQRAKQMTKPAPLTYRNLTGKFSLATTDQAWLALMRPGASAGQSLVINGLIASISADERGFPDDEGIYVPAHKNEDGEREWEVADSDIVCFRSAPTDADGYHSLIQVAEIDYELPVPATVTLEKVEEPGEWEVAYEDVSGLKVQRRLFTVRVSYKI